MGHRVAQTRPERHVYQGDHDAGLLPSGGFLDESKRTYLLGINPGRFGAGTTGVPFTDPVSLERQCRIPTNLPKRRELSAEFIEALIARFGGPRRFYRRYFITAICPVGFTRNGINYNYYDDRRLLERVRPFIVETLRAQVAFGARRERAIVLGTGKNFAFFSRLNGRWGYSRSWCRSSIRVL